jgi:putative thioredoxin
MTVPVVIDFWATWCAPCKQLSPILERLAQEYAGRWVLAKVDVDANRALQQAAGVQSIPTIMGVLKGQPVPLFMGALPEREVRRYLDELLRVAAANGVTGVVEGAADGKGDSAGAAGAAQPDRRYADAIRAMEKGDLEAAAEAYRKVLRDFPNDPLALSGLGQVEVVRRTRGVNPVEARAAADAKPDDVAAQTLAADIDVIDDRVDAAFARLVETVRRSSGRDREAARRHLLELFDIVGPDDPRVRTARGALASALF